MHTNWDHAFATAHLGSWPPSAPASLCIQNAKPPGGRNLFQEDQDAIAKAAARHGYVRIVATGKAISFIRVQT